MTSDRFRKRKEDLVRAVARLVEAASEPPSDIMRDAVIKRFEFSFELTWKTLALFLQHQGLDAASPRQTIRLGLAHGIIESPDEADEWFSMLEDRNLSTHTYDEALAEEVFSRIVARHLARLAGMCAKIGDLVEE
jgi:nucleotidyltransferase substrate binding protein (TIGR01987 family)